VSEVHLCADIAGWEPCLDDAPAFITREHRRKTHTEGEDTEDTAEEESFVHPSLELNMTGRRCTVSRKDWMQEIWRSNGWDGEARVARVEFRYKRECLREMGVEEAYAFLDQVPSLWAYSTKQWLRHTAPNGDSNRARWPISPLWELVQHARFFCDGTPDVRERRRAGDLTLLCQMIAGCSTSSAAFLTQALPPGDDGTQFLIWLRDWFERYLTEKGLSFEQIRNKGGATRRCSCGLMRKGEGSWNRSPS
jgi:hypothetical protein